MTENDKEDRQAIYEIGYLIAATIPEEKIPAEADALRKIVNDAGASIIAEEPPYRLSLAYTIRRKTVAGSYQKFDSAYFGWFKFEAGSGKVESIRKIVELQPSVIRSLLITTVRENTYLGKRVPAILAKMSAPSAPEKKAAAPAASIEEMDKSIDEMVKEA